MYKSCRKLNWFHFTDEIKKSPDIRAFLLVEVTGVEPVSKHDIQKLSTCLFPNYLSGDGRNGTNQQPP